MSCIVNSMVICIVPLALTIQNTTRNTLRKTKALKIEEKNQSSEICVVFRIVKRIVMFCMGKIYKGLLSVRITHTESQRLADCRRVHNKGTFVNYVIFRWRKFVKFKYFLFTKNKWVNFFKILVLSFFYDFKISSNLRCFEN